MGERAIGLGEARISTDGATRQADTPRGAVRLLEGQITGLRDELGALVTELDRRRHEALDLRLQVRRHKREIALTGAVLAGMAVGYLWVSVSRGRRRQRFGARLGRFQQAVNRMVERPERVAVEPTVTRKILGAAASAAAATVIRKVLARALEDVMEHRRLGATDAWSAARPPSPPRIPPAA
jgi:hypothetical protein